MNELDELKQRLKPYQGIIFDLDNTIFPQKAYDHSAFVEISKVISKKYQLNQEKIFSFLIKHRNSPPPYKADLFGCCCRAFNLDEKEAMVMLKLFRQHKSETLHLDPRYQQLFTDLLKHKKMLLLITNGILSVQQEKINKLQLSRYFQEILICTRDGEIPLKPNPKAFDLLQHTYQCQTWVMVGDLQETDGLFAENSGIDFIQHQYCGGGL